MLKAQLFSKLKSERGAALVSTLLISTLLLGAGTALILTTAMTASTAMDSTAEVQAYYGAEAGLNETLNVIRGNVEMLSTAGLGGLTSDMQKMRWNFRLAVDPSTSNTSTDPLTEVKTTSGAVGVARLSRWLNYTYPSSQLTNSLTTGTENRVPITPDYDPLTGIAYSVQVTDPDDLTGTKRAADPDYQPDRLLVVSTGYGPRGAVKRLEMMINRVAFEYKAPSTVLLRNGGGNVTFDIGSSAAKGYTGHDSAPGSTEILPVFGFTSPSDKTIGDTTIGGDKKDTVTDPHDALLNMSDLPSWLQSADKARQMLSILQDIAKAQNRYYTSFPSGDAGSLSDPKFTFVNGSATIGPGFTGAGLLIITGDVVMKGNFSFDGLILVMGGGADGSGITGGSLRRNGGGNGEITGAIVVAKFGSSGDFLAPTFDTNGGGNSDLQYNSESVKRALDLAGRPVVGIVER